MRKVIYLLASALGGVGLGSLLYVGYAYIQLITVDDDVVNGLAMYQLIGAAIGFAIGKYLQTQYKYWSLLSFSPKKYKLFGFKK